MVEVPNTLSAFLCGAMLILSLVSYIRDERWRLLMAIAVLNGVFAWVL